MSRRKMSIAIPQCELRLALELLKGEVNFYTAAAELNIIQPSNVYAWLFPRLVEAYQQNMIQIEGVSRRDYGAQPLPRKFDADRAMELAKWGPIGTTGLKRLERRADT